MASPSDGPLKRFIHEIHRRSLWQVLGIYLVASWAVLQVVDTLMVRFGCRSGLSRWRWSCSSSGYFLVQGQEVR